MASATTVRTETLKVSGATLYYEVRGSGPVLLMIPGGPTDAGIFADTATRLADAYTVVTYDPRGHSRSPLDGEPADIPISVHADDAAALLAATGSEPANVFGSSGGATIGLELVSQHPELVGTFVAHEPPVMELLPDRALWRDKFSEISDTYRKDGVFPAMGVFGAAVQEGGPEYEPQSEPTPEQQEMMGRVMGNFELFIAHEIRAIGSYVPDVEALKTVSTRVVIGAGRESGQQGAYRAAVALACRLGIDPASFPGSHGGWETPEGAETIRRALQG